MSTSNFSFKASITPLGTKDRDRVYNYDKIDTHIRDDIVISESDYHNKLICPECRTEYTLGKNPKKIGDSLDEVENRFLGKRRQDILTPKGE